MLSVSHSLSGAFVASKFPNPWIYIPVSLGLHYLEDWIPHWDFGTGLKSGKRKPMTALFFEIFDLLAVAGLVYLFWQQTSSQPLYHIWTGALVSLVPDFIEAPKNFWKIEPKWLKPFNRFHDGLHSSRHSIFWGLIPQFLIIGLVWFLR